ncbi:hypothetical protein LBYZC6_25050 [Lacrimispora brassicae]
MLMVNQNPDKMDLPVMKKGFPSVCKDKSAQMKYEMEKMHKKHQE